MKAIAAIALLLLAACHAALVAKTEYGGQTLACVDTSTTRADEQTCLQKVNDAWNEAGAAPALASDAGKDSQ